jgi:ABC-2 type transport system permease protein
MKTTNPLRALFLSAWKDIQVIAKDRGLLVVIILLPAVFSILFGSVNQGLSKTGDDGLQFPIAIVNQDEGPVGEKMAEILESIEVLKPSRFGDAETGIQQVRDGKLLAAVLIPAGLSANLEAYEPSEIEILVDPAQEQFTRWLPGIMEEVAAPFAVQGEISYGVRSLLAENEIYQQADEKARNAYEAQSMAVQMAEVAKMLSDPWIRLNVETREGKEVVVIPQNLFAMVVPSFTVLFAFFTVGAMAAELLKERQQGSLRRLIAAPMPRWTIIGGKMLAYMALILAQVTLIFGGASFLFDMPLGESLLGLFLVTLAMGLAASGMGTFIAAISKSDRQADNLGLLLGFVLGGLGGCFVIGSPVPLYKGGGIMETIAKLTPQAHALMGYDQLLIGGAGLLAVLPQVGILCGFGLVFLLLAAWRFRFE